MLIQLLWIIMNYWWQLPVIGCKGQRSSSYMPRGMN